MVKRIALSIDRVRKMNKGATVPMSGGFKVAFVHAVPRSEWN